MASGMGWHCSAGAATRVVGMVQDVTLQREAQAALQRSEEEQRTLIAALPDVIMRLDRDGRHLFVSENIVAMAAMPASAIVGRTHRDLGRMMRDREIERRYLALVYGPFPPALSVDRPIGRDPRRRTRQAVVAVGGRDAITHFRRLEEVGDLALIEARLEPADGRSMTWQVTWSTRWGSSLR